MFVGSDIKSSLFKESLPSLEKVTNLLRKAVEHVDSNTVEIEVIQECSNSSGEMSQGTPPPKKKFKKSIAQQVSEITPPRPTSQRDELTRYLQATEMHISCPLTYWKERAQEFPKLAMLARRYLGLPASTGSVERMFSIGGIIGRCRRSKMTIETMENVLLFYDQLKQNSKGTWRR